MKSKDRLNEIYKGRKVDKILNFLDELSKHYIFTKHHSRESLMKKSIKELEDICATQDRLKDNLIKQAKNWFYEVEQDTIRSPSQHLANLELRQKLMIEMGLLNERK